MILSVIIALALGAPAVTKGGYIDPNHPFFEFAPLSGAGMTTACACATVTGSKGEVMTFTRASSATCLKTIGTSLTNVAPGDMVTCASGQPRVMPGLDGTSWNGITSEKSGTNFTIRNQEIDNSGVWSLGSSGVALPTITADVALSPLGSLTADRVQVPATTGSQFSQVFQNNACGSSTPASLSFWLKGHGGTSGTLDLCTQAGTTQCKICPYNGTSWSWCTIDSTTVAAPAFFIFGSNAVYGPGTPVAGAAADVDVWGPQCEGNTTATSTILTAGASATRATEVEDVAISWPAGKSQFCAAATVAGVPSAWVTGWSVLGMFVDELTPGTASTGSHTFWPYYNSPFASIDMTGSAVNAAGYVSTLSIVLSGTHRFVEFHTGGLMNSCMDGTCAAGASSSFSGAAWARVRIGRASASNELSVDNAVIKGVVLDDSATRCR